MAASAKRSAQAHRGEWPGRGRPEFARPHAHRRHHRPAGGARAARVFDRAAAGWKRPVRARRHPRASTIRKKFSLPAEPRRRRTTSSRRWRSNFRNDGAAAVQEPRLFRLSWFNAAASSEGHADLHPRSSGASTAKPKGIDVSWFAAQNYPLRRAWKNARRSRFTRRR